MGRKNNNTGVFYSARDTLLSDRGSNRKNRQRGRSWVEPQHRNYWVPGVSIRRPVCTTESYEEFIYKLNKSTGRSIVPIYPFHQGLTILAERSYVKMFRQADIQPTTEDTVALIGLLRVKLEENLKEQQTPRILDVKVEDVSTFGHRGSKIGFGLKGWKGPSKKTEQTGTYGPILNGLVQYEAQSVVDAVDDRYADHPLRDKLNPASIRPNNPHIAFLETKNGEPVKRRQLHEITDFFSNYDEDVSIQVFDPFIFYRPSVGSDPVPLQTRAPNKLKNIDLLPFDPMRVDQL